MSHKYFGFQKEMDNNVYTVPFLSTKTQRLRFLNGDFVGYGKKNEFFVHKKPGLTIVRLDDNFINTRFYKQSNTQQLMTEFLNQLLTQSRDSSVKNRVNSLSNQINVKQVTLNTKSAIRITLNNLAYN